ncbi:HD domain-containing protein [Flavobacterium enshiense]|uniref:HD domain-containing protein n=1 Tax=Flavobacterium enshiense TaxID=1341165 RepID=UPI00345D8FFA
MSLIVTNNIIDTILHSFESELGKNYAPYRNHVYRVYNFSIPFATSEKDTEKLSIAAAFHDIGIWTNNTLDYLKPSAELAKAYCIEQHLNNTIAEEIELMIDNHHKLSKVKASELAEIFRKADLTDLTFGLLSKEHSKENIRKIRKVFPNKGFHLFLIKLFFKNLITNPLHPFPIFKL